MTRKAASVGTFFRGLPSGRLQVGVAVAERRVGVDRAILARRWLLLLTRR
jgi:hypothetical protein